MEGLQPIKFEPRTYHPTCHWLAGLNHCSSVTSNVKWHFYLPPLLLVETHIMKTYKWIARLLAEWIVAPLQNLCEQRTWSPSHLLALLIGWGEGRGEQPVTVRPRLLQAPSDPITGYQLPITSYQSPVPNRPNLQPSPPKSG